MDEILKLQDRNYNLENELDETKSNFQEKIRILESEKNKLQTELNQT